MSLHRRCDGWSHWLCLWSLWDPNRCKQWLLALIKAWSNPEWLLGALVRAWSISMGAPRSWPPQLVQDPKVLVGSVPFMVEDFLVLQPLLVLEVVGVHQQKVVMHPHA